MATEIITSYLYNGEVQVDFYPKSHMYKITDKAHELVKERVKGVTTYLGIKDKSVPLVIWATETAGLHLYDILASGKAIDMNDVREAIGKHKEIKDEAATIGTAMHEWCEYFIKHKIGKEGFETPPEMPSDPQIALGVNSFLEWYIAHDVQFLSSERVVYSRKNRYIGTMDFDAIVDGKMTAGDFKSSNGLYNSVRAQLAAYVKASEEEAAYIGKPIKYESRVAVRLSKETESEYNLRMERKNMIKDKANADFEPYAPFEWKVFNEEDSIEYDFEEGFITCKRLHEWDSKTDFYKNK